MTGLGSVQFNNWNVSGYTGRKYWSKQRRALPRVHAISFNLRMADISSKKHTSDSCTAKEVNV